MKNIFKKIAKIFFIYFVLLIILGTGLNIFILKARAQKIFHLDVDKQRWDSARTSKFKDGAVREEKVCTVGENEDCQGIDVSKFLRRFDLRTNRPGTYATRGQFLKWNSSNGLWGPYSVRGVTFRGKWNISYKNDLLSLVNGRKHIAGDYYVVDVEGIPEPNIATCKIDEYTNRESCDDDTHWRKGDWAIWNGESWQKISYTGKIESLFGSGGLVQAQTNDYTWNQINKEESSLSDITDVSSKGEDKEILVWRKRPEQENFWWGPEPLRITSEMIKKDQVITSKIRDGSLNVTFGEEGKNSLKDESITTTKLGDDSIVSDKISDEAITTKVIAEESFTTPKLSNGSVKNEKMANSLGISIKIEDEAITQEKIKDGAVLTDKIKDEAVIAEKLFNHSVVTKKIKDRSISSSDFQDGVIDSDLIPLQSVTKDKIANGAIVSSKIKDGSVVLLKFEVGSVTTQKINDGDISTNKLANQAVATGKVGPGAVTTIKIKNGDVRTAKIAAGSVTTAKIQDNAITASKLTNEAVTTAKLADSSVTSRKISDESVTAEKIALYSVTTSKIPDGGVTTLELASQAVTTEKIVDGTLMNQDFSNGANIARSKVQAVGTGKVVYNDDLTGKLSSESSLSIKRGGNGANNTQDGRSLMGIRPGVHINRHYARLDDIIGMSINAGDMILGGDQSFKLSLHNSSEVRGSMEMGDSGQLRVLANGNVGISETTPQSKLEVSGASKIRGQLNMNNNKIQNVLTENPNVGSSQKCAEIYQDSNYGGIKWAICPGSPMPSGWDNLVSSLKVPSGGILKVCNEVNGTGSCYTYTADISSVGSARNDRFSYVDYSIDGARITSYSTSNGTDLVNKKALEDILKNKSFKLPRTRFFIHHSNPINVLSYSATNKKGLSECVSNNVSNLKNSCKSRCTGCFFNGETLSGAPGQVDGVNKMGPISCSKPKCPNGVQRVNFMVLKSASGRCMTLAGTRGSFNDIKLAPCNKSREQRWFESTRNGKKYFHNEVKGSGRCLDAEGGQGNGARLIVYPCHWANNQVFSTIQASGGYVYLRPGNAPSTCVTYNSSHEIRLKTNCSGSSYEWNKSTQVEYFGTCNLYGSSSPSSSLKTGRCSQIGGTNNGKILGGTFLPLTGSTHGDKGASATGVGMLQTSSKGNYKNTLKVTGPGLFKLKVTATCNNVENESSKKLCSLTIKGSENQSNWVGLNEFFGQENSMISGEAFFKITGNNQMFIGVENSSFDSSLPSVSQLLNWRYYSDIQFTLIKISN